jgi:hypothetical protein
VKLEGITYTDQERRGGKKCLVFGDSVLWNVGTEQRNMVVECFPEIRTDQLHRGVENRALGIPDTVVNRIDINDFRRRINTRLCDG